MDTFLIAKSIDWDYNIKMSQRKNWTSEQDEVIRTLNIVNQRKKQCDKLKWSDIAEILNRTISDSNRTGKQCRERWHNQLHPSIKESEFSHEEIQILFRLQDQVGNKWATIAKELPGRTDNNIKNFFYSSLRRALRQVNSYVGKYKKKSNIKPFKQLMITKILTIKDEKYRVKLDIKTQKAAEIAQKLKIMLGKLSLVADDNRQLDEEEKEFREDIVRNLQQFNKCCKKKKEKRKVGDDEPEMQIEEEQFFQKQDQYERNEQLKKRVASNLDESLMIVNEQAQEESEQKEDKEHPFLDSLKNMEYFTIEKQFQQDKMVLLKRQSSRFSRKDSQQFFKEKQFKFEISYKNQEMLFRNYSFNDRLNKKESFNELKIVDPFNTDGNPTMFASINLGEELIKVNNQIFDSCFMDRDDAPKTIQ